MPNGITEIDRDLRINMVYGPIDSIINMFDLEETCVFLKICTLDEVIPAIKQLSHHFGKEYTKQQVCDELIPVFRYRVKTSKRVDHVIYWSKLIKAVRKATKKPLTT